jgi:hypothetical protein
VKNSSISTFLFLFSFLLAVQVSGQIGGNGVYKFLELPNSARVAAMGGNFLAINDADITLTLANPSLINEKVNNQLGISFVDYYTDINYGFAQYGRDFQKVGSFVGTMQFISYGEFDEADESGQRYGTFTAGEYALNIGWGRPLTPRWSIGANYKLVYSHFYDDNSFGMAVDVAGSYHSEDENFTASLLVKNIGFQVVPYNNSNNEPLPFEIQAGISQKLKHVPFRYSILLPNLQTWDLNYPYEDPNDPSGNVDPITGEVNEKNGIEKFADNLMRHIVFGGEWLIGKNFSIQAGYNYGRRQDMKIAKASFVGFSAGVGLRISAFEFSYARSAYHLVGSPNFITITADLGYFGDKKAQAN